MKHIRILSLLLGWLIAIPAMGQFNPTNPPEPEQPQPKYQLSLSADPAKGGSVSGEGRYRYGEKVNVSASAASGFVFVNWVDEEGSVVSTSRSFSYVMPERAVKLTAHFRFDPGNPSEPDRPEVNYANVNLVTSPYGGGSVSGAGRYLVGSSVYITTSPASGFSFIDWTLDGESISTQRSFYYHVREGDNTLTANFKYTPSNPDEPSTPATLRRLFLKAFPSNSGYFNISSGSEYEPGKTVRLTANANTGFVFSCWVDEQGDTISADRTFDFIMPAVNTTLTANFRYSPSNPGDPSSPEPRRNVIYGQKLGANPGAHTFFDINLENTDMINGIAVDVKMPDGFTTDFSAILTSERSASHTVSTETLDNGFTRIQLRGEEAFKGSNGALLRLPVTIAADAEAGTTAIVSLDKGVVYKADGSQSPVDAIDGIIKIADTIITLPDSPDFVIEDIQIEPGDFQPGDRLSLSWKVANRGVAEAFGGWSEVISLTDAAGNRSPLATLYYDTSSLKPDETIARSADLMIPSLPGIAGDLDILVTLIPFASSGEIEEMQVNNSAKTDSKPIRLGKLLILEIPESVEEGDMAAKRCRLVRSGNWNVAETFNLKLISGDTRLVLPETVTIARYQSAAYFTLSVKDNSILDESDSFTVSVAGNGYPETTAILTVIDNEMPTADLVVSQDELAEGETATLTITLPRKAMQPTEIRLISEYPGRLSVPVSVSLAEGEAITTVEIKAIDNKTIDGDKNIAIRAESDGVLLGETYILVVDNDIPNLSLEINPTEISEGTGVYAARAVISRSNNLDSKVTVRLSDDSKGQLYLPYKELVMAPGVEAVEFSVGVKDNTEVDGDREVVVTAAVYISSCNCTSQGNSGGVVSQTLLIIDDDGPALTITPSNPTLIEGDDKGIWLTVSRNTDTSRPVEVTITADDGDGLLFDEKVIIAIGDKTARVKVTAPANLNTGDGKTIVFTATASDYAKATCWVMVTDNTLPDARISSLTVTPSEGLPGGKATVKAIMENVGNLDLPEMTTLTLYADNRVAATLYLQQPLAPGETSEFSTEVTLPEKVGRCEIYGVVNEGRQVKETIYSNNRSEGAYIEIQSPYSLTLQTDKPIYQRGEIVKINGQVTAGLFSQPVEVFVLNQGSRQAMTVSPNEAGEFFTEFTPWPGQCGVFSVGAGYPGANNKDAITSFEIPALKVATTTPLTIETVSGETGQAYLEFVNMSSSALTSLSASIGENPSNWNVEISVPNSVAAGAKGRVQISAYSDVPTEGNDWVRVPLTLTGENGEALNTTLYLYCVAPTGALSCNVSRIVTNITVGKETLYPLTVTNRGKGETGTISVNLPEWMSSVTPTKLPSLAYGESAQIVLRLGVTDRMNLNHPVTGQLGLNCTNGNGLTIGYSVTPVSEEKGTLIVEAADEYTYYTEEAPFVKGAAVKLYAPATGATVFTGLTGEDGKCATEVAAGFYRLEVSAEKHETYSSEVYVSPGEENLIRADIGYNPITFEWNVVETEVEDEYEIETVVTYETDVPMPVVKMDVPKRIDGDSMAVGDAVLINMTLTNIGLIKAMNVTPRIPHDLTEWEFEILDNAGPFDLAPQQSKVVPIKITRIADLSAEPSSVVRRGPGETLIDTYSNCMTAVGNSFQTMCGKKLRDVESAENLAMKMCATAATMSALGEIAQHLFGNGTPTLPGIPGGAGGGGGSGSGSPASSNYGEPSGATNSWSICNECDAKKAEQLIDTLLGMTWLGNFNDILNEAIERYRAEGREIIVRERPIWQRMRDEAREAADELLPDGYGDLAGLAFDIYEVSRPCEQYMQDHPDAPAKEVIHSWITDFEKDSEIMINQLNTAETFLAANLGDRVWWTDLNVEKADFIDYILNLPEGATLTDDEIMAIKPSNVSFAQAKDAVGNITGQSLPEISDEDFEALASEFQRIDQIGDEKGFEGYARYYEDAYERYRRHFDELSNNTVCASVTLKISQQMTLTRQAFRGYLTVFNGHESKPIQDLRLNLVVRDTEGNIATSHEFQINPESLDGFTGALSLSEGWDLAPSTTGNATVIFIPSRFAAPDEEKVYSFGGSITYVDPYNDMRVTRTLYPVELTVRPTPELELTYFLQRDVYGDDPLTPDVVEPSVPAEFALLINNVGAGDAKDVKMITAQPEIIENEKGLAIEFEFLSSQLNGGEKVLSLGNGMASEFGDIAAYSTAYAQWWLQSSLLGHFVDYDVSVNHLTSYGNPDLSLITDVRILELIHGFTPETAQADLPLRGFLVNEVSDSEDMPDMIYFTNGDTREEVANGAATIVGVNDNEYKLTVNGAEGWCYGKVADLTAGRRKLSRVVRESDGAELPVDNFWQTSVTLRDGKSPVHEAILHFICKTQGSETYVLTFEPCPLITLQVEKFSGCPDKNGLVKEQVKDVMVKFNKPIDAATFGHDDIILHLEGEKLLTEDIVIDEIDESTFSLDLSAVTVNDGYYVLTVMADGITDLEGFSGENGASTSWIQYVDGMVGLTITAVPAEGGSVSPRSGKVEFGVPVILNAEPNEGYQFDGWWADGEEYSTTAEITYMPLKEAHLEARFSRTSDVKVIETDKFRIWPLPLANKLYIDGDFSSINSLSFFTIDGKCVWQINDVMPREGILLPALPSGVYVIKVESDNGFFTLKTIKY